MIWLQELIWLHANSKCTGKPRGGSRISRKGFICIKCVCVCVCGGGGGGRFVAFI